MIVRLVLWNLADSKTNVAELREWLRREGAGHFERMPGLVFHLQLGRFGKPHSLARL